MGIADMGRALKNRRYDQYAGPAWQQQNAIWQQAPSVYMAATTNATSYTPATSLLSQGAA